MNGTLTGKFDYDLGNDLRAVEAMANGLVPYVYDEELYGLMPSSLPRLTIGSLLMRVHRLDVLKDELTPAQRSTLEAAQNKLQDVREKWHVAYTNKLKRELKARIEAVEQYLNECSDNLRACADNYPSSMEKRVMITYLMRDAEALGELTDEMRSRLVPLDNAITRFIEPGEFRWDPRLERVYPPDEFWFLYRAIKTKK